MNHRILGRTRLSVGEIGIGCWAIGGPDWNLRMEMGWGGTDDTLSLAGLHRAFELGANYFDTADVYGHGHSERILGAFLKEVPREQVVLGTKVGYFSGSAPYAYHPLHMRHQLEMSLNNFGTEYVDIYYFHNLYFGRDNEHLPDAVDTMRRFLCEGKIRAIGQRGPHSYAALRNIHPHTGDDKYQHFLRIASVIEPAVIQVRYNMISPTFDEPQHDIFAWAQTHDVGVIMNKPLAQGLLIDKYDPGKPPAFVDGDHRRNKQWFRPDALRILQSRITTLKKRFGDRTEDLVRVALQYCLARSTDACVAVGFTNPSQIETNLAAADRCLSQEDVEFIRTVMSGVNAEIGGRFIKEESAR
jgi:aryl-alcohol dehydrogenase-like predicted oxidoreductase